MQPAFNHSAAVLQALNALSDDELIGVINAAFGIAFAAGRAMVTWADVVQAYEEWVGEFLCLLGLWQSADFN